MEIEYEGPNLVQEYRAALQYLNIVDGAQTRLGITESEVMPKRVMKPQTALASPPEPSVALSYVEMAKMESERAQPPAFDIEGQGQNSMQAPEASLSNPDEGVNPSEDLLFKALARASRRAGRESAEESAEEGTEESAVHSAEQTAEPAAETKPSFQDRPLFQDKPTESEGAVPKEKYTDEKFKGILKRLGLSS